MNILSDEILTVADGGRSMLIIVLACTHTFSFFDQLLVTDATLILLNRSVLEFWLSLSSFWFLLRVGLLLDFTKLSYKTLNLCIYLTCIRDFLRLR